MKRLFLLLMLPLACGAKTLLVGGIDSLTYGYQDNAGEQSISNYPAVLRLMFTNCDVFNLGHTGRKVAEETNATEAVSCFSTNTAYTKRTYLFLGGINDAMSGDYTAAQIETNIILHCNSIRATNIDIVLAGLTMLTNGAMTAPQNTIRQTVNAWILSSGLFDVTVNIAADSRLSNSSDTTYFSTAEQPSAVHLSSAGYAVIAELVGAALVSDGLTVDATTYYVRKDGNDANTGTSDTSGGAWLTIQHAAETVVSGSTVYVGSGNYDEVITEATPSVTYIGSGTTTNGGFILSATNITIRDWNCNASGVAVADGVIDLRAGASFCTLSNITLVGSGGTNDGARGVNMVVALTNCYIDKFSMVNPNAIGFVLIGKGHTVTNCYATGTNGWDLFRLISSDSKITHCIFTNWSNPGDWNANHTDLFQVGGTDPGDSSTNNLIESVLAIDCDGCQLGNVTDDQQTGQIGDWTFRNNVFVRVASTLNLYAPNCKFYNNTFYQCATNGGQAISPASSTAGHAHNLTLYNNLFVECGNNPASTGTGWYLTTDAITNWVADYNLVVGTGAGTTKSSDWTAGGREVHGINGSDPLFAGATDFHVLTNSPAIGAGTNLSAIFTTDYTGTTRSDWTIGAYETAETGESEPIVATHPVSPRALNQQF